ncbi:hypothetical protein EVU96_08890 [Bacillus infantis]|uniref:hypothetical protein n=1 Tax=Bacillus infantis TaxID=324767 RepID=UPI00101C9CAB|nr:hypothetical protein [Bacillus infantis]RYI30520.1 hypothetical protein EVU96_08890 [Bacillus infantis]
MKGEYIVLAGNHIEKILDETKEAYELYQQGNLTEADMQRVLGLMDQERKLEAAKILLREELKEIRDK